MGTILLLATLDTKGVEARFLADQLRSAGHQPHIMDTGIAGQPQYPGDTTREQLAASVGLNVTAIASKPRAPAMQIVAGAASEIVRAMFQDKSAAAIMGIGGGTGTWLSRTVMLAAPISAPKVLISTFVPPDEMGNIILFPSMVDIAGMNRLLAQTLSDAAAAVSGILLKPGPLESRDRPLVALTMFGVTTAGGNAARTELEAAGCEVMTFHANGRGGATMERLIAGGMFDAVLDWTITEITDELTGGVCSAGPHRLEAASARGIPQVIVPGAIDVINFLDDVPARFAGRPVTEHLPKIFLVRTSVSESAEIGRRVAAKVRKSNGPVAFLIPGRGFSAHDRVGGAFYDPEADTAFVDALRNGLDRPSIDELPLHINDPEFGIAAAKRLLQMLSAKSLGSHPIAATS